MFTTLQAVALSIVLFPVVLSVLCITAKAVHESKPLQSFLSFSFGHWPMTALLFAGDVPPLTILGCFVQVTMTIIGLFSWCITHHEERRKHREEQEALEALEAAPVALPLVRMARVDAILSQFKEPTQKTVVNIEYIPKEPQTHQKPTTKRNTMRYRLSRRKAAQRRLEWLERNGLHTTKPHNVWTQIRAGRKVLYC